MELTRRIADLRRITGKWRASGRSIGVVPTMGGLHDAHASLISAARADCDRVIVTMFLNPTQFGAAEDMSTYPRDEAADLDLSAQAGADLAFLPAVSEMYPDGFATRVVVDVLADVLCGAMRPGHFEGMTQVVTKLLNISGPDVAYFGEKDWQQLQIVKRLVRDLDFPVRIAACPTAREPDGLALSTRNRYLTARERRAAPTLFAALSAAADKIARGAPTELASAEASEDLVIAGFSSVDYIECRDAGTLRLSPSPGIGARVFGAAQLGRARLIDNVPVPALIG